MIVFFYSEEQNAIFITRVTYKIPIPFEAKPSSHHGASGYHHTYGVIEKRDVWSHARSQFKVTWHGCFTAVMRKLLGQRWVGAVLGVPGLRDVIFSPTV